MQEPRERSLASQGSTISLLFLALGALLNLAVTRIATGAPVHPLPGRVHTLQWGVVGMLQSRDEILLMTRASPPNQIITDWPEPTGEQSGPPGGDITPLRRQPHFMLVPSLGLSG